MLEEVRAFLEAMGIPVVEDDYLLKFFVNSVTEQIKNETNQQEIPEGLHFLAVEMAAGHYLNMMKGSGQLQGFNLEAAVKQIQEGDTNIVFAIGEGTKTPEQRLDALIAYLIGGRTGEFIRYRRLVW